LVTRIIGGDTIEFKLFNPSIKDYVISICQNDVDLIAELLFELNSITAYKSFKSSYPISFLNDEQTPDTKAKLKILERISEENSFSSHLHLFISVFNDVILNDNIKRDTKSKCISFLVDTLATNTLPDKFEQETLSLLKSLIELNDLTVTSINWLKLIQGVLDTFPTDEILIAITRLLYELNEYHDIECEEVINSTRETIWEYCADSIHNYVSERVDYSEDLDIEALKYAKDMIEEYEIELGFTGRELLEHIDFDVIRQEMRNDYEDDSEHDSNHDKTPIEFNEIEDLFEKT
jgi:hypothetical protein